MQIVTDRGMDLSPQQMEGLSLKYATLRITLEGKTYSSGVDIDPATFYQMLSDTEAYPTTSQPSAGEFAEIYRSLAQVDPEILSIHISSGLSGTVNAARAGAAMVPEAKVTIVDSKTLSCPFGWQVEAGAKALKAGWSLEQAIALMDKINQRCEGMYTLASLRYLIHGGRISHLKGLLASLLNIKPVIGVEKEGGTYINLGQEITLKRGIHKIADQVASLYGEGSAIRVQLLHGLNLEGVEILKASLIDRFECHWEPTVPVAPALGAHTGPSLVGLSVGPWELFAGLPWHAS